MRFFNTSGACVPEEHYTVMREALVAQGEELVAHGRFFTIFAPRQTGKTTYFQLLFRQLRQQGFTPLRISFESLHSIPRAKFYHTLGRRLAYSLLENGLTAEFTLADQVDLQESLEKIHWGDRKLVLVIDEFEETPAEVLSELLHAFRNIYQYKQHHALHALILVGVSTLAELVVSSASPFNVVDQLQLPYFTFAEVEGLIQQYVTESGQPFDAQVIKAIYDNTQGQPGLVNALCQHLVTVVATDRSQPVRMADFYPTLKYFLTERFDKNILNIVQKAREKRAFMLKLLFSETAIPFNIHDTEIAYLYTHGVIDNVDGYVQIAVPLYNKALITALRPPLNGEAQEYVSAYDNFREYLTPNGLNIDAILTRYREYVQRRGYHAFDTEQLKEGAWHYSLDGFINFFIQRLGGDTLVEVPSGRGRTDILILHQQRKYIIETKIFTDAWYFEHGKQQLADYLVSEGIAEGFYVVFTQKHSADDTLLFDETIEGKRIRTYLIRTDFEPPSSRPLSQQRRTKANTKPRRRKPKM
ncbi:MAG: ATP-binding protein [Caldilinea sp. CFX5]|nr:ATP-binding protein [Caldilinea sp. CFX5]